MITESLGIKGWGKTLDRMILTSIVTGDPLLILANYGQGKTALVDRLGQVIVKKLSEERPDEDLIVAVINAATANPQDWAGYFIPPKNGGTTMELLKSPQSLIDAVLIAIDEISRAATRNQNNVLTLIQERRVDGIPTKCEMIFAMMNPVMGDDADEGSEPLIGAVADRFSLLIEPPLFHMMAVNDKKEVIYSAYKPFTNKNIFIDPKEKELGRDQYVIPDSNADDLWEFFVEAKRLYIMYCFDDKYQQTLNAVVEYVSSVSTMLTNDQSDRYYFSGRRAGMILRAIIANYCVGSVLGDIDLPGAAEQVLMHSIMNKAMGKDYKPYSVKTAHDAYAKILKSGSSPMTAIMAEPDKWKRLGMAFKIELKPDEFTRIYKDVVKTYAYQEAELIIGLALFERFVNKMSKHELSVIGKKIIEATGYPIKSLSLEMRNANDAIAISRLANVNSSRIMAICIHLYNREGGHIFDHLEMVSTIYNKALDTIKGEQ